MYQPGLLLPSDDYRGNLLEIAPAASGTVLEFFAFWLIGILSWAFAFCRVRFETWSYVVLPLIVFDLIFFAAAASQLHRNYNWLLASERKARVVYLFGTLARLGCASALSLHFFRAIPMLYFVSACGGWFTCMVIANCWARSWYVWTHIAFMEAPAFFISLEVWIKQIKLAHVGWSTVLWPLTLHGGFVFVFALTVWYVWWNSDRDQQFDSFVRIVIVSLSVMGVCYMLAVLLLGQWLDSGQATVVSWAAPLFVAQLLSVFAAVCFAITFTVNRELAGSPPRAPYSTPTDMGSPRRPLLVSNMRVTLEKVGNNFYRLTSGIRVDETAPLRDHLLEAGTDVPVPPNSLPPVYGGRAVVDEAGGKEGAPDDVRVAIPCDGGSRGDNGSRDVDTCLICYSHLPNAVFLHCGHGGMCEQCARTYFRRSGRCPTCRQIIHSVAAFDVGQQPPAAQHSIRIEARIRDTK